MRQSSNEANEPPRRGLRMRDFCEGYGVSRATAYKLMKAGKLKSVRVAGRRIIPVDAAEALLEGAE
jgi:predicted site-specific integrase-resolvase